jgi:ferritin
MLISEQLQNEMNTQVGRELGASNQYLALGAYFEREALLELASFFYRQSEEEREHAMKFVHFLVEAGAKPLIPGVQAPKPDVGSAEAAVKLSLDWEVEVTRQINALMDLAIQKKDHQALGVLDWFVSEQLEEVSTMETLLAVIRRAGPEHLLLMEDYLARRAAAGKKDE